METSRIAGIRKKYINEPQIDMHEDTRLRLGLNRYSQQRKYSKVKPADHMMEQVLSEDGYSNSDAELSFANLQSHEASQLIELFPTRAGFPSVLAEIEAEGLLYAFGEEEEFRRNKGYSFLGHSGVEGTVVPRHSTRDQVSSIPGLGEQSSSQLTIWYNGTVNVYDICADKAEAIMLLAFACSGNANAWQQSAPNLGHPTFSTPSNASSRMAAGSGSDSSIATKKSIQSFLVKRKHRLNSQVVHH